MKEKVGRRKMSDGSDFFFIVKAFPSYLSSYCEHEVSVIEVKS